MSCIFCNIPPQTYIAENDSFYAIKDQAPVTEGHTLIISKRHFEDFFGISELEMIALHRIVAEVKTILDEELAPDAYNIGANCGKDAGQHVFHFHLHIIPRFALARKKANPFQMKGLQEYVKDLL